MKVIKTLIILSFIFIVGCSSKTSNEIDIILLDVKEDFLLLELLKNKKMIDAEVREKFELGFIRKLLLIRSVSLNIETLKGAELSGLCHLVKYTNQSHLSTAEKKMLP